MSQKLKSGGMKQVDDDDDADSFASVEEDSDAESTSPSWKIPKALYSPETFAVESSVLPSPVRRNNGVSQWSKHTSPRFADAAKHTCQTQYDLDRADKYLKTSNGSVMLGAPRVSLAKKLDSHALGNVPNFLRKVKSFNVKSSHMAGQGHDSIGGYLPNVVRPKRTADQVQRVIKLKRIKKKMLSKAGQQQRRRKQKSDSYTSSTLPLKGKKKLNVKSRYLGRQFSKTEKEQMATEQSE